MANIAQSFDIDAPPERVWAVIRDVERWPEWTPRSMRRIELLDGPMALGARARVEQPRLRAAVMTVTVLEEGRSFTWQSTPMPGVRFEGVHSVEPRDGGSHATLIARTSGPLAPLLDLIFRPLAKRYTAYEAEGLKSRSEGG